MRYLYLLVIMLFVWSCNENPTSSTDDDNNDVGSVPNTPSFYSLTPIGDPPDRGMYLEIYDDSNNEDGFTIQRKDIWSSFIQVADLPANTKTYTDWGLEMSTSYTYRIKAYNEYGSSAWSEKTKTSAGLSTEDIIVYPTEDSFIDQKYPSLNMGTMEYLFVEDSYYNPGEEMISFIKFPVLQSLPYYAVGIEFAEIVMFSQTCDPIGGPLVGTHRVMSDWSESTVTWNNQPSFSWSASTVGTTVNNDGELVYFEITTLVSDWFDNHYPDYGVALCTDNSIKRAVLFSKDTVLRPWLEVTYNW